MRVEITELQDLCSVGDGVLAALFRRELQTVLIDLVDRPVVGTARKICLDMSLKPVPDDRGHLAEIEAEFEVYVKTPKSRTQTFSMAALSDKGVPRGLVYNDLAPDDRRQMTLDEVDPNPNPEQENETDESGC